LRKQNASGGACQRNRQAGLLTVRGQRHAPPRAAPPNEQKKSALSLSRGALEGPTRGGKNTCRSFICKDWEPFSHSTKTLNNLRYCATLTPVTPARRAKAGAPLRGEPGLRSPCKAILGKRQSFSRLRDDEGSPSQPPWDGLSRQVELIKRISSTTTLAQIRKQEESDLGCFARTADEPREQARMDCPPGLLVEPCGRLPLTAPNRDTSASGCKCSQ
jgi:hypothetical protein